MEEQSVISHIKQGFAYLFMGMSVAFVFSACAIGIARLVLSGADPHEVIVFFVYVNTIVGIVSFVWGWNRSRRQVVPSNGGGGVIIQ